MHFLAYFPYFIKKKISLWYDVCVGICTRVLPPDNFCSNNFDDWYKQNAFTDFHT
jgi:hypothetical protein